MQKISSTKALLDCKCPRCRQGDLFQLPLNKFLKNRSMYNKCTVCNLAFEPEPGFYYGAMFISYAVSVAVSITSGLVLYNFFNDPDIWIYLLTVLFFMLLLSPLTYRYSRSLMLHIFGGIQFDASYIKG